jgi:hypothetical protein
MIVVHLCALKQIVDLPLVLQHEVLAFDPDCCDCALLRLGELLWLERVRLDPLGVLKLLEKGDTPSARVGIWSCLTGPTAQDRQVRVVALDVRNQFVLFGIEPSSCAGELPVIGLLGP